MSQNLQNFAKFKKIQLDNLVDFENCCKKRIYVQRSVPIQPKMNRRSPTSRSAIPSFDRKQVNLEHVRNSGTFSSAFADPRLWTISDSHFTLSSSWRCGEGIVAVLYQNEILQENTRLTAFLKLYKICILCTAAISKFSQKNRYENQSFSWKCSKKMQMSRNLQNLPNFKNFRLKIW